MMLELGYIVLSFLMSFILIGLYYQSLQKINNPTTIKKTGFFTLALLAWFVYLFILSGNEILLQKSFPPLLPILIFLPGFLIAFGFVFSIRNSPQLLAFSKSGLIYYQSFRILVEIILWGTFLKGIIPETASFEGLNFDVVVGLSAPFVAYFAFSKKAISRKALIAWNVWGILMVLFVGFIIVSSYYFPSVWGAEESLVSTDFFRLPYFLVPAFLAPSAIFVHILSITQLSKCKDLN